MAPSLNWDASRKSRVNYVARAAFHDAVGTEEGHDPLCRLDERVVTLENRCSIITERSYPEGVKAQLASKKNGHALNRR